MDKLPISALLVIYNEEKLIERCLRSCYDLVDEIIVVHDGPCSDRSIEIVKKYTDKIYIRKRVGESDPHRPFTLKIAKNNWILQLDADEFLSDDFRNDLAELINNKRYQGYELLWTSGFHKNKYYCLGYKLVLANKKNFYFIGAPHQSLKPINSKIKVKKTNYLLEHKPLYEDWTFKRFREKWNKWDRLEAKYYVKDFSRIPKYNCPINDWEWHTRLRIKHPLLLGIPGSAALHSYRGLKGLVKTRQFFCFKGSLLKILSQIFLYYYVWKYKRQRTK